jgi:hypothetical protein
MQLKSGTMKLLISITIAPAIIAIVIMVRRGFFFFTFFTPGQMSGGYEFF